MKKRAMKKWIPKGGYCCNCKWLHYLYTTYLCKDVNKFPLNTKHIKQCEYSNNCSNQCWTTKDSICKVNVYKCDYLNLIDYDEDTLLWDGCKECYTHDNFSIQKQFKKKKGIKYGKTKI